MEKKFITIAEVVELLSDNVQDIVDRNNIHDIVDSKLRNRDVVIRID